MKRLALALVLLTAGPAVAQDWPIERRGGVLVMVGEARLQRRAQTVFISQDEVRVRTEIVNPGAEDITLTMGFRMPHIGGEGFYPTDPRLSNDDVTSTLAFETLIDGRRVETAVYQKAEIVGVDQTAWLKAHGVPLTPHRYETTLALDRLSPADKAEAEKRVLASDRVHIPGPEPGEHWWPSWVLTTVFYWTQTFPAGQTVTIEHRYTPTVRSLQDTPISGTRWGDLFELGHQEDYCLTPEFEEAVRKRREVTKDYTAYGERRLGVMLSGAGHYFEQDGDWTTPIGEFRLVIDRGSEAVLAQFCAPGPIEIDGARTTVTVKDYRPPGELKLLFLTP